MSSTPDPEREDEERIEAIRARATAAITGPWRWYGNTETDALYLATTDRGRLFICHPMVERIDGYQRKDEPYDFIEGAEYERLSPDAAAQYEYAVQSRLLVRFQGRDSGQRDRDLGALTEDFREIARYEVLDGQTLAEAGLKPDANPQNSPLYREDIVGLDNPEAEFIAHAREDVDTLLARLDEAERERDAWCTWQGEQHQATYDAKARAEAAEAALREAEEALALHARNELERTAVLKREGAG